MFNNEFETAQEFGHEMHELGHEFGHEFENYEMGNEYGNNEFESYEMGHEFEMHELHESQEMELAHELLSVSNEQELNHFLGKFLKKAVRGIGKVAAGPLGGILKQVAKTALPIVGKAAGGFFGGPLGAMVGGKLGSMATRLFELELEGLSPEDREFEVARAYIRFANGAAANTNNLVQRNPNANPQSIARAAVNQAARVHAPGLLRNPSIVNGGRPTSPQTSYGNTAPTYTNGRSVPNSVGTRGTWVRRGRTITLY